MKSFRLYKNSRSNVFSAIFVTALVGAGNSSAATTALIDFGTSTSALQSGFSAQTSGSANYATDAGQITVASSGNFFNRSSTNGYTDDALLGDFTFENNLSSNALTLTISGAGIAANTAYDIRFYSYDSQHGGGGGTVTYQGTSGTTGSTSIAYSNTGQNDPGFGLSNSSLSSFTSNSSGVIEIGVTGTSEGPRVSGMEITVIPEPSVSLLGLVGLSLILLRRR